MSPLGDRLGAVRRRRGLTQEQLAEASGVDVSTIRKLEQGARSGGRLETLRRLARALDVATSELFEAGSPGPVDDEPYKLDLIRLRQVLTPAEESAGAGEVDLDRLWRTYESANRFYALNQYAATARAVPELLTGTRQAARELDDGRSRELLCYVLHLTGQLLTHIRQYDLAYFPLREAIDTARGGGDELTAAFITSALCWLFMRQGRLDEAERVAVKTADAIEPKMSRARPEEIGAWGRLLLFGAGAAVRNNRVAEAEDMLALAEAGASRLTNVHHHSWAAVGPFDHVTVARRRVEHAVITGETRAALDIADGIVDNDAPTAVNRNRYLLDVAHAHAEQRSYAEAFDVLLEIRRNVPEWMQHQRYARDVMSRLLSARARAVPAEMRELADFLGVD